MERVKRLCVRCSHKVPETHLCVNGAGQSFNGIARVFRLRRTGKAHATYPYVNVVEQSLCRTGPGHVDPSGSGFSMVRRPKKARLQGPGLSGLPASKNGISEILLDFLGFSF